MAETILSYLLAEESSNPQRIRKGFRKKWAVWDQEKTASLLYPVGRGWRMGALTPRPLPSGTWPKASNEAGLSASISMIGLPAAPVIAPTAGCHATAA